MRTDLCLLLVRHALTNGVGRVLSGRSVNTPLNAEGRDQAAALGKTLQALSIDAIYASPQKRAVETATIVANCDHGMQVIAEKSFDECDFGEWTGRSFDELQTDPQWLRFNESRADAVIPGGETPLAAQARVLDGIAQITQRHRAGVVVVVTHAENIRSVVLHHAGMSLDAYATVDIAPASVTVVRIDAGVTRVLASNLDHVMLRPYIPAMSAKNSRASSVRQEKP